MSQKQKGHIHQRSETKHDISVPTIVVCVTCDVEHTSESVSTQEGHSFRMIEKKQDSSIPKCFFYQSDDFFWIGKPGKEKRFKKLKNLEVVHFLLLHREKDIPSVEVQALGKTSGINDVATIDDELVIKGTQHIHLRSLDSKARAAYKARIEELIIKSNRPDINPEERIEINEEIEELKASLKERTIREANSREKKAQVGAFKNIQRALTKIHKELPDLEIFLNKSTIRTGYSCSYLPIPSNPIEWILFKE